MSNDELFAALTESEPDPIEQDARASNGAAGGFEESDDGDVELDDDVEANLNMTGRRLTSAPISARGSGGAPRSAKGASSVRPSGSRALAERAVLLAGDVVDGKYRVDRIVGRRGSGIVVEATHLDLNQVVTIRHPPREVRARPGVVARFLRQARAACQIQSEHAARILDVGRLDSGVPFLVMEGLKGWDLEEVIRVRGPLPAEDAVDYLVQACEAIAEGHGVGLVHRSIGLANLVLTRRPDGSALVKVLDFGVPDVLQATPFAEVATADAESGAFLESLRFLSPEQVRSADDVDARADVWALGAALHELVTGAPAFYGDTPSALLASIVADPPRIVTAALRGVPLEIESVIARCLAKDRTARFQNVADFVTSLRPFAPADSMRIVERISRMSIHSRPPPLPSSRSSAAMVAVPRAPQSAPTPKEPARSTTLFGAVAMVGVVLGAILGVVGTGRVREAARVPVAVAAPQAPPVETASPVAASGAHATPEAPGLPPAKPEPPARAVSHAPQSVAQSRPMPKREAASTPARPMPGQSGAGAAAETSDQKASTSKAGVAASNAPKGTSSPAAQAARDLFDDTR